MSQQYEFQQDPDFPAGCIVRLKSGSPDMIAGAAWSDSVAVSYFHAPSGEIKTLMLHRLCLEKVRD